MPALQPQHAWHVIYTQSAQTRRPASPSYIHMLYTHPTYVYGIIYTHPIPVYTSHPIYTLHTHDRLPILYTHAIYNTSHIRYIYTHPILYTHAGPPPRSPREAARASAAHDDGGPASGWRRACQCARSRWGHHDMHMMHMMHAYSGLLGGCVRASVLVAGGGGMYTRGSQSTRQCVRRCSGLHPA